MTNNRKARRAAAADHARHMRRAKRRIRAAIKRGRAGLPK